MMAKRLVLSTALLCASALFASPGWTQAPSFERRVNDAVDKGVAWLVKQQAADGSWWQDPVHPLGRTALATYAILHAGYSTEHPAVKKALAFLGLAEGYDFNPTVKSTYETGCLLLLLNALGGKKHKAAILRLCDWLADNFQMGAGLWGYPGGAADLSNTQYAVMGLKVGMMQGYKPPPRLIGRLIDGTLAVQHSSGAFRYNQGTLYRATMTHSALLTLALALEATGAKKPSDDIRTAMEKGHLWFEKHYAVDRAPFGEGFDSGNLYYYLYGLERYAIFFGKKAIGGHDWYREGAEVLVSKQADDGVWENVEASAFAILFLRRVDFTESARAERPDSVPAEGSEAAAATSRPTAAPRPDPAAPFLTQWLIAGPFRSKVGEDDMLLVEPFPIKGAKPAAGGAAGKEKWVEYEAKDKRTVELGKTLGEAAYASFFAATYLHVAERTEAVFWVGWDDGGKAYLDGKEILYGHNHDYSNDDRYRVPLTLEPGVHTLIVKVENIGYYVYFRARLTDALGKALQGVQATTKRNASPR